MSGAMLALAFALLVWPPASPIRDRGLAHGAGDHDAGLRRRLAAQRVAAHPVPMAGVVTAGTAAVTTPLVAVAAGLLVALAARARIRQRRDRRAEAAVLSLTEGLGALAAELRSGRPLLAASASAAAACSDREAGLGLSRVVQLAAAGEVTAGRAPVATPALRDALDRVAAAVRLSARTGCSLAAVLAALDDDLRARHRAAEELRAATAGPRASAALLSGLPLLALAMGSGVGADPWRVLTTTPVGQVLLVAGIALELAGIAWSGRMIRWALR